MNFGLMNFVLMVFFLMTFVLMGFLLMTFVLKTISITSITYPYTAPNMGRLPALFGCIRQVWKWLAAPNTLAYTWDN